MTFPILPPLPHQRAAQPPGAVQAVFEQPAELWVVGDIHGALGSLQNLLQQAGLLDAGLRWQGGKAHLVCLGDYMDRGPSGAETVRFIRTLQRQAQAAGGHLSALVGNHEVMLLAAVKFRAADPADELGLFGLWQRNGGRLEDLAQLEPGDLAWMRRCPALLRVGQWLFQHADSLMYQQLGADIASVNASMAQRLEATDPQEWRELIGLFTARMAYMAPSGTRNAEQTLLRYQARCLVHGHTPVQNMFKEMFKAQPAAPQRYAGGLCLNVDSGMVYQHGNGFMVRLGVAELARVVKV